MDLRERNLVHQFPFAGQTLIKRIKRITVARRNRDSRDDSAPFRGAICLGAECAGAGAGAGSAEEIRDLFATSDDNDDDEDQLEDASRLDTGVV